MKLQDQMYDAVADVSAGLPALVDGARRRGQVVRRRRRLAIGTTAAAAVAVGAVGVALALHPTTTASDSAPASGGLSGSGTATAPNTGRTTTAALVAAVDEVTAGEASDYAGQDPLGGRGSGDRDSYGEFLFAPDAGGAGGVVEVNVQDLSVLDGEPRTCDPTYMTDCHVSKLPGGDLLRTYVDRDSSSTPGVYRNVAELISPSRHLRVTVGASNSRIYSIHDFVATRGHDVKTRPDAVLSIAQVSKVVTEPWWGFQLPAAYEQAGKRLSPYNDLTQKAGFTPGSPASSSPGVATPSGR